MAYILCEILGQACIELPFHFLADGIKGAIKEVDIEDARMQRWVRLWLASTIVHVIAFGFLAYHFKSGRWLLVAMIGGLILSGAAAYCASRVRPVNSEEAKRPAS